MGYVRVTAACVLLRFYSILPMIVTPTVMERPSSRLVSTRRKSCVACVKAKRRCDLQRPHCTRCSARGLLCNYPENKLSGGSGIDGPQPFDLAFEWPHLPWTDIPFPSPAFQFDDILSSALIPPKNVSLSKERLDFCVRYFKEYLTNIVERGRAPFINPSLYSDGLPPCLQDVYLICAAYQSKTATNEALVFNILSGKFSELVSKHQYCSPEDELASVQALIIYQIIRLFDGDIRQRGTAEVLFQVLNAWVTRLRQRNENELSPAVQCSPYRKWLYDESVRRTVLMSIFLEAIYEAAKNGFCDKVPDMAILPLTVRGELWDAESESEWMLATRGSQPDVKAYHNFVEMWDGASVRGYVEDFQKMLLVACIGEEGIQMRMLESLTRDVGVGVGVGWA